MNNLWSYCRSVDTKIRASDKDLPVKWVPITELPTLVEQKSKQTALNDRPEQMSLPINDLSKFEGDI